MKTKFLSLLLFLFLFTSCATKLPNSFSKKTLEEKETNAEKRYLNFKKTTNFRDIGGISTLDGKTIKWGKIYRSDNLSNLKNKEFSRFDALQIKTVIDLRTKAEIAEKKDNLPLNTNYISVPIVSDQGDLMGQMKGKVLRGEVSEDESKNLMEAFYIKCLTDNIPLLQDVITKITTSEEPILYHCTAGKDRTGIVTAILFSILNVDRETIVNEYLLSNYYRSSKIKSTVKKAKLLKVIKPKLNTKVIVNFMSVDKEYINAVFEIIDSNYGGMDQFIEKELKIDPLQRKKIADHLTY